MSTCVIKTTNKKKLRSFLVGNVCQNKCAARNSARQDPMGLAILIGFPHHLSLSLPLLFVYSDLATEILLETKHNREGMKEPSTCFGAGVDGCIRPQR